MMRKKLVAFLAMIAMLSLCIAVGSFSALAEEPSAQTETKVYNAHVFENLHYQNRGGSVTPTASGIKFETTAGEDFIGAGSQVGLFTEVTNNFEVTVEPGAMYALKQQDKYTRIEYLFGSRVEGNTRPTTDFTAQAYMIYLQINPIEGNYANGASVLVIAHNDKTGTPEQVWGQTSVNFPAGANGNVKVELVKNDAGVYQLVVNGQAFDDNSFGGVITINDVVTTVISGAEKPFMTVSHSFDGHATGNTTLTSYVKTVNGVVLKDFTDVVGGDITETAVVDSKDWINYSSGSVNYSRSSVTEKGFKVSGDFAVGNGANGYPTFVYNKAMPANLDEYSVTITDLVTVNETRASIWWSNAPVASWTSNQSVIMMRVFTNFVQVFVDSGNAEGFEFDVAPALQIPYTPIDGSVTIALRKTFDGYVVVVNGKVMEVPAVSLAVTLSKLWKDGSIYFGTGHDYDNVTVAGKYSHVISQINGTKFAAAEVEPKTGEAIEYTNAEWSTNLSMGSNARTYTYENGLKIGTTLAAGVPLADAQGVAGGWNNLVYTKAFANDLDEYSVELSIDNTFYENAANYGKTIVYFVDILDNTYPYGKFIAFSIESEMGDITKGGNVRVTSNVAGDSNFVGFAGDGKNVTIVIRKTGDDYNMYVNGTLVRFMGGKSLKNAFAKMANVYVGVQTEYAGAPSVDTPFSATIKAINGSAIVNPKTDVATMTAPVASNVTKTSATLTWTAFSNDVFVNFDNGFNAVKYVVERKEGENVETFPFDSLETVTYTDTELEVATTYVYTVTAVDANNNVVATYASVEVSTLDYTNFTELNTAIANAEALVAGVTVSVDGAELANGAKYYVQADVDTYNVAIATAKAVAENTEALQAEVNSALATLNGATETFKATEKTVVVNFTELNTAIANAEAFVAGVTVSVDGAELANGAKYYVQADVDTYNVAIATAKAVAENTEALQAEVDSALATLNGATETFTATEKTVVKEEPSSDSDTASSDTATSNSEGTASSGCFANVSTVNGILMAIVFVAMAVIFGLKKEKTAKNS